MGKVNAVIPGYFGKENLRDLTGVQAEDEQMDKQDIAPALLGRIRADFLRLLRNAAPSAATYLRLWTTLTLSAALWPRRSVSISAPTRFRMDGCTGTSPTASSAPCWRRTMHWC